MRAESRRRPGVRAGEPAARDRPPGAAWAVGLGFVTAAIGVLLAGHPAHRAPHPFARQPSYAAVPRARPAAVAFGQSREVKVRFTLPGSEVDYPLEVAGDPSALRYEWISAAGGAAPDSARTLGGASVVAPTAPGFYHLALVRDGARRVLDGLTIAVLVPFSDTLSATLNGYRIGTYRSDPGRGGRLAPPPPAGFVEIGPQTLDLRLTTHIRLADFVGHDSQQGTWPKYAAVDARLLDKLELVIERLSASAAAGGAPMTPAIAIHSGYRAPRYNRTVRRAARDSRHQYGDAADVAIDADGDGRVTAADARLVAAAVDAVERDHPELVGGVGVYTSRRYRTPYVHIDARGMRARWRG